MLCKVFRKAVKRTFDLRGTSGLSGPLQGGRSLEARLSHVLVGPYSLSNKIEECYPPKIGTGVKGTLDTFSASVPNGSPGGLK